MNTTIKNQLLQRDPETNNYTVTTVKQVKEILDSADKSNLNREFTYKLQIWKTDATSTLNKQFNELIDLLKKPCYHFMESPTRWWSEFRHFVKHIDF